ncbi:hypothetical protein D3C80_2152370 [compost metagenome]
MRKCLSNRFDNRQYPPKLLLQRHRLEARSCGFPAYVEYVSAVAYQLPCMDNGIINMCIASAIRE